MCTRPVVPDTTTDFRIGGVVMRGENRAALPAAILVMSQLVASHVVLLDDEGDDSDWFASRFWEGCNVVASALRKYDETDALSVK